MKRTMIVMALLGCLFLGGCNDGKDSSSSADITASDITTVSESVSEKQATESERTTTSKAKNDTSSQNRLQEYNASADKADIVIGGENVVVTTMKSTDKEETITNKAKSQQTTANTKSIESKADNSNVMPDDGLDWSPLVPVN